MPDSTRHLLVIAGCVTIAALATGCATVADRLAPEADADVPVSDAGYRNGDPVKSAPLPADWWRVFGDETLNGLIAKLNETNPDISAALARVDQSFAALGINRAKLFPSITANASLGRRRDSINNLLFPIASPEYNRFRLGSGASWEIDLWGRVRATVKRDRLRAEASALDYRQVMLSLQSSLAQQYFAWRAANTELNLLRQSHAHELKKLELEEARLKFGQAIAADVARAKLAVSRSATTLETSERGNGRLLNAIAVLTGVLPSELDTLADTSPAPAPPAIPVGLPSELLEQRPDLIAADRRLRAAAAQIGAQRVSHLPRLTLIGNAGIASLKANNLFEADSGLFDIGPQLDVPIFRGRVTKAAVAQARGQYREAAAKYRSVFLSAVREVDDALLDAKSYTREITEQQNALAAATEAAEAAKDSQQTGLGTYDEYLTAEQVRLETVIRENAVASEQRLAAVRLIQALGGGWDDDAE